MSCKNVPLVTRNFFETIFISGKFVYLFLSLSLSVRHCQLEMSGKSIHFKALVCFPNFSDRTDVFAFKKGGINFYLGRKFQESEPGCMSI